MHRQGTYSIIITYNKGDKGIPLLVIPTPVVLPLEKKTVT